MIKDRNWDECVRAVKDERGVLGKHFMFIHGGVLKDIQKCYCTKKAANNKRNNNVKK